MSKDTDVMSQSVIQVWNGWPGAFVECKRLLFLQLQDREGKGTGFCLFFWQWPEDFLGGETHSKSTSRRGQSREVSILSCFYFLFHVRDNLLILSSLYELRLFFPDFRVEPVI